MGGWACRWLRLPPILMQFDIGAKPHYCKSSITSLLSAKCDLFVIRMRKRLDRVSLSFKSWEPEDFQTFLNYVWRHCDEMHCVYISFGNVQPTQQFLGFNKIPSRGGFTLHTKREQDKWIRQILVVMSILNFVCVIFFFQV